TRTEKGKRRQLQRCSRDPFQVHAPTADLVHTSANQVTDTRHESRDPRKTLLVSRDSCLVSLAPSSKRKLLTWFDRNARQLPWRADRNPYRIWVSEVMLQQTTVAAVAPRFEQFLVAFPDVHALAAADEQDVLKVWEGMGYYSRARNLHRAARRLVETHGGAL